MSLHERTYRLLLRAYPEGFRSTYGREMEQVFRDQRREAAKCDARLWAETMWDVVRSAPALRMEATRALWYEDIHPEEGKMKTMARLAMTIGAVVVASALFALITLAAPRMSLLTTLLGVGFPVALLLFLRRSRVQGPSAPTMAALVFALSLCAPVRSPAQAPARDSTRGTLEGKDLRGERCAVEVRMS